MGDWIVSVAGTDAGARLALGLALFSALAHASFGALIKGASDPYLIRGAINLWYGAIALPFALFALPHPTPMLWACLAVSFAVHVVYELLQTQSFERGAFTLVYPIARGTGPLVTLVLAALIFGERFSEVQWSGGLLLSGAIMGLALANIRTARMAEGARGSLAPAIRAAVGTGVMLAIYTSVDAYGIRQAENPFTFLAWFFTLGALGFPFIALARWRRLAVKPPLRPIALRGLIGACIALLSFGTFMIATRVGSVGETAALRETSIVFATAIGVLVFRERIDATRLALIALIAAGAVLVEVG